MNGRRVSSPVVIGSHGRLLEGMLHVPSEPCAVVILALGSGAGRAFPEEHFIARVLETVGVATLLLHLGTADEEALEAWTRDRTTLVEVLAARLASARSWVSLHDELGGLPIGYCGVGIGAAAALVAAAWEPEEIFAVISLDGRAELAGQALGAVRAPTLLVLAGGDPGLTAMNEVAQRELRCINVLTVVPGPMRLADDAAAIEQAARLSLDWVQRYLQPGLEAPASP